MSIQVVCPSGHQLNVKDRWAGRVGFCPVCKARVKVPTSAPGYLSEEDILNLVGPPEPRRDKMGNDDSPSEEVEAFEQRGPPKKICDKCNGEIDVGTHICPICRTYIGG